MEDVYKHDIITTRVHVLIGLMISAFARGFQVLEKPEYLELAIGAAQFIRDNLYKPNSGHLLRNAYRDSSR